MRLHNEDHSNPSRAGNTADYSQHAMNGSRDGGSGGSGGSSGGGGSSSNNDSEEDSEHTDTPQQKSKNNNKQCNHRKQKKSKKHCHKQDNTSTDPEGSNDSNPLSEDSWIHNKPQWRNCAHVIERDLNGNGYTTMGCEALMCVL